MLWEVPCGQGGAIELYLVSLLLLWLDAGPVKDRVPDALAPR